ncbi:hypothetical protein IMCC26256_11804 [Actinobacteria bacterium IMCC26256]|nr:hypothetical protein IMCC26256_11804 [Actinobacteria bacterium IMCC26256]
MIALALPILIVVGIIFFATRNGPKHSGSGHLDTAAAVAPWLERWKIAGLVEEGQIEAIIGYERTQTPLAPEPAHQAPVVAEALAYGGALLAAVGIGLMINRFDLTPQAGAVFAGCVAVFLIVASRFVHPDTGPAWWRLHQVVAFLGAAALAVAVGLQVGGVANRSPEATALSIGSVLAIIGWFLYKRRDLPLQQLGFFAACISLVTGAAQLIDWHGQVAAGALLLLGVIWILCARRDLLPPTALALTLGSVLVSISPYPGSGEWPMFAFPAAAAIAALLVIAGGLDKRPVLLVVGLLALFQAVPTAIVMTRGSWVEAVVALGFAVFGAALLWWGWQREEIDRWVSHTTGSVMLALTGGAIASTWRLSGLIVGVVIAVICISLGTVYRRSIVAGFGLTSFAIYAPWLIASEFGGRAVPIGLVVVGVAGIGVAVRMLSRQPAELSETPEEVENSQISAN